MFKRIAGWSALTLVGSLLAAAASATDITGAGATFPYPVLSQWSTDYSASTGIKVNYQSIGSGGGIAQIKAGTVDFGASDKPLNPDELAQFGLAQFPIVIGGVVPVVNIEGVEPGQLKLTGPVIADIFLGKITKWNDPAIAKVNPGVNLPGTDITIVHRSDGSGTTYIWADYLAKVSPEWKQKVGVNGALNWPVGVGGKGSDGVTGLVKQTPGSLGYVELTYALQNKIGFGSVQNAAGEFIKASTDSVTAAATAASGAMPKDFRVSITNAPGKGVYPISSFTWLLLYENPKDKAQSKVMVDFMKWALTDGQKFATTLGYAPLPEPVVKLEMEALKLVKVS
jgi:phosphate transport system substrate-binding protein